MDRKAAIAAAGVTAVALVSAGVVLAANLGLIGQAAGGEKESISAKIPSADAANGVAELPPEVVTIYRDEIVPGPATVSDSPELSPSSDDQSVDGSASSESLRDDSAGANATSDDDSEYPNDDEYEYEDEYEHEDPEPEPTSSESPEAPEYEDD